MGNRFFLLRPLSPTSPLPPLYICEISLNVLTGISDSCLSQGSKKSPNARPCGDIIYSSNRNSLLSLRRKDIVNDDSNLIYLYFSGQVSGEASRRDELREPFVLGGGFIFPEGRGGVLFFPSSYFFFFWGGGVPLPPFLPPSPHDVELPR